MARNSEDGRLYDTGRRSCTLVHYVLLCYPSWCFDFITGN